MFTTDACTGQAVRSHIGRVFHPPSTDPDFACCHSDSPMPSASPRIGTMAASDDQGSSQAFATTTGLIFPGPLPDLRAAAPLDSASAPASTSAPKVHYTHSSQFQQQVELYRGRCVHQAG